MNDRTDRKAVQINRIHTGAICNEIGERLCTSPLGKPTALSTDLLRPVDGVGQAKLRRRELNA